MLVTGFSSDRDDDTRNGTNDVLCMVCKRHAINRRDVVASQQAASDVEQARGLKDRASEHGQEDGVETGHAFVSLALECGLSHEDVAVSVAVCPATLNLHSAQIRFLNSRIQR